jgi:hypothetical protein
MISQNTRHLLDISVVDFYTMLYLFLVKKGQSSKRK